jgi:hypothetical protein
VIKTQTNNSTEQYAKTITKQLPNMALLEQARGAKVVFFSGPEAYVIPEHLQNFPRLSFYEVIGDPRISFIL